MEVIVGIRDAKELMKRKLLMLRKLPDATRLEFSQYSLPDDLADELIDSLPEFLKELGRDEMVPILQISTGGTMLYPHKGHYRKASIFKLLRGDKETTTWWKNTEDFKVVNEYRIPDVRKLAVADQAEFIFSKWSEITLLPSVAPSLFPSVIAGQRPSLNMNNTVVPSGPATRGP